MFEPDLAPGPTWQASHRFMWVWFLVHVWVMATIDDKGVIFFQAVELAAPALPPGCRDLD